MLVSPEEAEARLTSPNNLLNRRELDKTARQNIRTKFPTHPEDNCAIKPIHNGGRRPGDTNLSPEQRAVIGSEAQLQTLDAVADKFGISRHHAHELANGKVFTANGQDDELIKDINNKLHEPHKLAVEKLTQTLLALDEDKIKAIGKAKDLASVASHLSRIAENTAPLKHDDEDARSSARIIVYSPTIKQENHYSSVETTSPTTTE